MCSPYHVSPLLQCTAATAAIFLLQTMVVPGNSSSQQQVTLWLYNDVIQYKGLPAAGELLSARARNTGGRTIFQYNMEELPYLPVVILQQKAWQNEHSKPVLDILLNA